MAVDNVADLRAMRTENAMYDAEMEAVMAHKDSAMSMLACVRLGCSK